MIGIGSAPGSPRSSIIFLMSMLRSATLRAVMESVLRNAVGRECHLLHELSMPSELRSLTFCSSSAMAMVVGMRMVDWDSWWRWVMGDGLMDDLRS